MVCGIKHNLKMDPNQCISGMHTLTLNLCRWIGLMGQLNQKQFFLDLQNVGEFLSCIRTVIHIFGSLANISYMYRYTV